MPDELSGQSVECPVCNIKFTAGQSGTNSVYDVKPLIALCEQILHDEEVSAEELYELAEFLNANPEAGKHWPGNQLVGPLQEVWADGVIDSRELAIMEGIIVEARRGMETSRRAGGKNRGTCRGRPDKRICCEHRHKRSCPHQGP